jgi:AhpD family alkylhydroperoxidase
MRREWACGYDLRGLTAAARGRSPECGRAAMAEKAWATSAMLPPAAASVRSSMRLDYIKASPEAFKAMLGVEKYLHGAMPGSLLHMIKLRVSQINGCAYCIDMHWKDARAAGETEQRLYGLGAWREGPYYSDKERAALAWAESLTLVAAAQGAGAEPAPEPDFEGARKHFSDRELADLTWAIASINAWNRIAIGFRATPGLYQPPRAHGRNA